MAGPRPKKPEDAVDFMSEVGSLLERAKKALSGRAGKLREAERKATEGEDDVRPASDVKPRRKQNAINALFK